MKNKGFTLVEVLGVIVILAVIFVLVFPSVKNVLSQSKETVYDAQINKILKAAYDFTLKNPEYLPNYKQKSFVTLAELKIEGLIDVNIKNPKTKKNFEDNMVVSINNVGNGYSLKTENSKLEGNYLYKIESNNGVNISLLPELTINNIQKNSDGNYIKILNLNDNLENFTYSATSEGKDITNKVKKYITKDGISVDSINTRESGIYKINYVVVNDKGYSALTILNIIVADTIPPTITFPEDTVISKDLTDYNLLKGVSCEDNSGFCDITYSNEIDYGVVGIQTIKYTVKDPSGNTINKKRVITIE